MSAVSRVLCVATCALWVRSHRAPAAVEFDRDGRRWSIDSCDGRLTLGDAPQRGRELAAVDASVRDCVEALERAYGIFGVTHEWDRDHPDRSPGARSARSDELLRLIQSVYQADANLAAARARARAIAGVPATARPVPYAVPGVGFGVVPLVWLGARAAAGRRHRRRMATGRCPACGYDLRATPGRCPECGAGVTRTSPWPVWYDGQPATRHHGCRRQGETPGHRRQS